MAQEPQGIALHIQLCWKDGICDPFSWSITNGVREIEALNLNLVRFFEVPSKGRGPQVRLCYNGELKDHQVEWRFPVKDASDEVVSLKLQDLQPAELFKFHR
ncbi:hypothetical protein Drorol1_Dr00007624 [Drosera rotundifolia]